MFSYFERLIDSQNQFLELKKNEVRIFFSISIAAMVLKTVSNSIEDVMSYETREGISDSDQLTNISFTIGVISFFSDLSFTALIFYYLMKSVAGEQEIYDELMDQGQSKEKD